MKDFKYIARDFNGQRREGIRQAVSASDVLSWLREQGLTPVSVSELLAERENERPRIMVGRYKKIKASDLSAFFWQMTTMLEGGIPVTAALETILDDIDNARLQAILEHILAKIHKGSTLSDSLAEFPEVFNKLVCAIVLAGETGGSLPESLRRLAEYFDSRDNLRKKIQTAMAYPIFVMIFVVLIVIFIMTFIIPRFKKVFDQFGGELPAFTRGFMGFYEFVKGNVIYIVGLFLLVAVSIALVGKTRMGHQVLSRFILRFPLLGKVVSQGFVATFCRTMSTMIAAGVSILEVFDILSTMTNNDVIRAAIISSRERIVQGANISTSLGCSSFFPNLLVKMIQVGEESGSMSMVLDRTANYYERKIDATVGTIMSLLEPLMIVTVGAIVLTVVLALYLPIFTLH